MRLVMVDQPNTSTPFLTFSQDVCPFTCIAWRDFPGFDSLRREGFFFSAVPPFNFKLFIMHPLESRLYWSAGFSWWRFRHFQLWSLCFARAQFQDCFHVTTQIRLTRLGERYFRGGTSEGKQRLQVLTDGASTTSRMPLYVNILPRCSSGAGHAKVTALTRTIRKVDG